VGSSASLEIKKLLRPDTGTQPQYVPGWGTSRAIALKKRHVQRKTSKTGYGVSARAEKRHMPYFNFEKSFASGPGSKNTHGSIRLPVIERMRGDPGRVFQAEQTKVRDVLMGRRGDDRANRGETRGGDRLEKSRIRIKRSEAKQDLERSSARRRRKLRGPRPRGE